MNRTFKVEFKNIRADEEVYVERLGDVIDGFWVNVFGQFTKGSDCKYFIMPHQIKRITKREG